MLWASIAATLISAASQVFQFGAGSLEEMMAPQGTQAFWVGMIDSVVSFFLIAVYIVCGVWIVRAARNAKFFGPQDPRRIGPGWAVGWYFIPIANLWKPYQAMRQIWNSSVEDGVEINAPAPALLKFWWAAWLAPLLMLPLLSVFWFWLVASGEFTGLDDANGDLQPVFAASESMYDSTVIILMIMTAVSTITSIIATWCFMQIITMITRAQARDNVISTFA